MPSRPTPTAVFGPFTLRLDTGELFKHGAPVPLQAQPARLLVLLVTRAGDVVTREEIRAHLWTDTVVSFDQNINYCIRHIRRALGDDAAAVLQTRPRQGYRFVGVAPETPRRWPPLPGAPLFTRRVVASLAVGLIAGVVLGGTIQRSSPGRPVQTEWRAGPADLPIQAVGWWRHVRAHLRGDVDCPYLWFLRSNSSPTHRSS